MNKEKVKCIKEAGKIVADALNRFTEIAVPGNTTGHINALAKDIVANTKHIESSFLGYKGYPEYVCTSVDTEVVHGIPSYSTILKEGSIISIDFAVSYRGWHADACITVPVGKIDQKKERILRAVSGALYNSIPSAQIGRTTGNISYIIQSYLHGAGFVPVTQFTGHAVGRKLHEQPQVLNFGPPESGHVLVEGMFLAIEPIGATSHYTLSLDNNNWTYRTEPHILTAHFEHTVYLSSNGPEIITKL